MSVDGTATDDPQDLARALAERALARATLGCALVGVVLGLLATGFLAMSSQRLDASTLPAVVLMMVGQVGGLAAAASAAVVLRRVRSGADPQSAADSAQRMLHQIALVTAVGGAVVAVAMPVLLSPRGTAAVTALIGAGVLAQVVVVLTVMRRPLRRAARAPRGAQPPASR